MPKIKQKRFDEMRKLKNVFEWSDYDENNPFPKGSWRSEIFKNDNPIVLELACGKAEYSLGLGELYPDKNFVAVDIKGNRMWVGAQKAIDKEMHHLKFLRAYIDHLDRFFAPEEIDEIWILFPDPYIKKERKRLTSPKFLKTYRKVAKAGIPVNLKTDSDLLFEYTQEVIEEEGLKLIKQFDDVYSEAPHDPELSIKTYYERMHLAKGKLSKFISFHL